MKKVISIAISILIVFGISVGAYAMSSMTYNTISLTGVVQTGSSYEERISDTEVKIIENYGKEAKADFRINDTKIIGNVKIQEDNSNKVYKFTGEKTESKEFQYLLFEGTIDNEEDKFFEAFFIEDNKVILNIFELNEKGDRIHPFTIRLDNNSSLTSTTRIEKYPEEISTMSDSGFVSFGSVLSYGIKIQTIGYQNNGNSTPHITRLWTRDISNSSSQPYITRINIMQARMIKSAATGSTYQPVNPNSSSQTNFNVPFIIDGNLLFIPVKVSSTSLSPSGFGNPHTVTYSWTLKNANTYYETNNSEGILSEHLLIANSQSPVGHNVNGRIWYEIVGAWREYFDFGTTSYMVYYK
jgi:hypothetical protein